MGAEGGMVTPFEDPVLPGVLHEISETRILASTGK